MSKEFPTIVFHASIQHSFGKGTLIHVLRQFALLHKERQQVSLTYMSFSQNYTTNFRSVSASSAIPTWASPPS